MSPTPRAALLVAVAAAMALLLPVPLAVLAVVAVAGATLVDAFSVRTDPGVSRRLGAVLARGVPTALEAEASPARGRARVRQPVPPYFDVEPAEADDRLDAVVTAHRRGRHPLADPAVRLTGPLGLGRWYHGGRSSSEVVVYPDLPAARRLAQAVRQGKVGAEGRRVRGPLGLGTDFESVREYVPDGDVRRINWRATARLSRPMTNQYRVD